jgi:hypothetical protein
MSKKNKIIWLLPHFPSKWFKRTAKIFQTYVSNIEIITIAQYQQQYLNGKICNPYVELREGRVQIIHVWTNNIGSAGATDFYALALPFLFKSREHAIKVLQGNVGQRLFQHLYDKIGLRGVTFEWIHITDKSCHPRFYPDAWWNMCFPMKNITTVKDNNSYNVRERNPIIADMTDLVMSNILQVASPEHSLYLSTILTNDQFINGLSSEQKQNFDKAVTEINSTGNEGTNWSNVEIDKLRELWTPIYKKYQDMFTFDIVEQIRKFSK